MKLEDWKNSPQWEAYMERQFKDYLTEQEADKQQEAVRKIMAERRVTFEKAVDIYIEQQKKNAT